MVCTAHRLLCKTPSFPKHKFSMNATRNVQTHLKSAVRPAYPLFRSIRVVTACLRYFFCSNVPSELKGVALCDPEYGSVSIIILIQKISGYLSKISWAS